MFREFPKPRNVSDKQWVRLKVFSVGFELVIAICDFKFDITICALKEANSSNVS